ncbi:hypothetical protein BDQ12DRAFT_33587 [Crucibulum laeve]|uniref:Uncharacterized protein n=1 Tax=Crucibulum laeve TaxID=68775 RepID=A0A5C3MH51_9AGAR|nr:hypothetical protein BDQ12DRAFT_33587 [Crucibulum laeve]
MPNFGVFTQYPFQIHLNPTVHGRSWTMSSSDTTNAYFIEEDRTHELTSSEDPALHFSDSDEEGSDDDEHEHEHSGDYSTRMDELFDDGEDVLEAENDEEDEDEDVGFLYTGVDAPEISVGYRDQLRDVLGTDLDEDEEREEIDANNSFLSDSEHKLDLDDDEPL